MFLSTGNTVGCYSQRSDGMKLSLLMIIILSASSCIEAQAQINIEGRKARPRAECERLCNEGSIDFAHNRKGLDKIRAEIEKEKDPAKLKDLRKKEENELERVKDKVEKSCTYICEGNPD
ncbi:hypothetical protein [Undibacterium sp. Tian12W]|uniref:hypothetical protein n=2 Tax=unclassified Undibacterium TaxID=2630295 RepID=UPI003BF490EF